MSKNTESIDMTKFINNIYTKISTIYYEAFTLRIDL